MTGCVHCEKASRATWHGYNSVCRGCSIRAFAASHEYFKCERAGKLLPEYVHALRATFGVKLGDDKSLLAVHAEIKAESQRIRALRAKEVGA